jgi:serine/threonine protein kinase/tetratricopeptide (TPR) repeat protein
VTDPSGSDLREQLQQVLGDTYRLEHELPGGMSRVFVAEELALARKVVIKVMPPETAAAVNVARFRREIQLAASLQHPHIVPLLSAGSRGDLLYYVMPLIEGESLRAKLLKSGELPVSDVAWILRDSALALAYAHSHGVVHRDIKPDNILLTGKFAVVADFGVAKAVSEAANESNITSAGVALGTPTYMAPEQASADPNTDHRADIYALGVVGYELLTGAPPFTGTSPQMILAAQVTRTPEHVTKQRASVPPALANVIMRCLEKKPADRWQTAEELAQQLASIASSGSTTPTTTAPYPAAVTTDRSRRPEIIAAFVLGLAAFAGVAWFAGKDRATYDDRRVIVSDFENQTRDPAFDPVGKLASDMFRQGISQTGVAEVAGAAASETESSRPGLMIRGRYYREGDSIRVQAEILDARDSKVVRALSPSTSAASNPAVALEKLRPRILGALASLNDPLIANWARKATEPPLYEAYRAWRAGIDAEIPRAGLTAGINADAATREFQKAADLDSFFVLPALELTTLGDSIGPALMRLYENRDRLTSLDRILVEQAMASARQEHDEAYKSARLAAEAAPDPLFLLRLGEAAIFAAHPREGVAALERANPDGQLKLGWGDKTDALHLIGDFQGELAAVESQRKLGLDVEFEAAQVLPALGRVEEVNALINERMRRPSRAEDTPAALMLFAAREYRAHGFIKESDELTRRGLAWYESRPDAEMTDDRHYNITTALFHAGRWADARAMIEQAAKRFKFDPLQEPETLGMLGRIAAQMGDTAAARNYSEKLRNVKPWPHFRGASYFRALIAAGLGDRQAVTPLLQQAFSEGFAFEPYLHREIEFQAMKDYPPLKELLEPKG